MVQKNMKEICVEQEVQQSLAHKFFDESCLGGYLRDFDRQGFCHVKKLFSEEEVHKMLACFDRLQAKAGLFADTTEWEGTQFVVSDRTIHRIVWACASEPYLGEIGQDTRITQLASKILGSDRMNHLICQAHYKIPGDSVTFPWHQDSENRGYGSEHWSDVNGMGSYVQSVLALDPMTPRNSPLLILPDSHRRGHLSLNKGDNRKKLVNESLLVPLTMDPGDVLFFGPYLIHGSEENRSTQMRRILINGFSYPGANRKIYPGKGSGALIFSKS